MYVLRVEAPDRTSMRLTQNESNYQVLKIDGLYPVQANIITSKIVGIDGSMFNSSKLESRNIVITIKICGEIEKNRLRLYKYFRNKQYCKIYYKNDSRDVYIEGYVEATEGDPFSNNQIAQISIICPDPYFKDMKTIVDDISKVVPKFKFPFSINVDEPVIISSLELNKVTCIINSSETDTGIIIKCLFLGSVRKLEIRNTVTGEAIILNHEFKKQDILEIDCNKGKKSIVLIRDNKENNLIPDFKKGSKFLQLLAGENYFSYLADDGQSDQLVSVKFNHYNIYGGV